MKLDYKARCMSSEDRAPRSNCKLWAASRPNLYSEGIPEGCAGRAAVYPVGCILVARRDERRVPRTTLPPHERELSESSPTRRGQTHVPPDVQIRCWGKRFTSPGEAAVDPPVNMRK